jgi:urease accessory protein
MIKSKLPLLVLAAGILAALPQAAFAHAGHEGGIFIDGIIHPMTGLDHLAAMIAVGLWATTLGKRALWMVPLSFVSMMVLGAGLSFAGIKVPFAEQGIVASILVLGLLIAFQAKLPAKVGMALVGAFAIFHGAAHGNELTVGASPALYTLGFVLSTAALHAVGLGLGGLMASLKQRPVVRVTGALMVLFAGILALGMITKGNM